MTLHLGLSHAHQRNSTQQQEIRDARRLLKERIRDDWDYPPLPAFQVPMCKSKDQDEGDDEAKIAGFKFHQPSNHNRDALVKTSSIDFEPIEWREREYSSDEPSEDESVVTATSAGSKRSIFRFEGPDSVGVQISDRKLEKKRKRQEALDEEVTWNDGLAHWLERRNAWSGAHTTQQVQLLESSRAWQGDSTSASANSTPRTSTSSTSSQSSAAVSSASTTPELAPQYAVISTQAPAPSSELLVPLVPPILVNHPIRRRITPEIYPEIYAKIILQSRTPSVPINLHVLTQALVKGWKDDGEWPPKQGPVEKSIGRKKSNGHESALKNGVRAMGRVLRITSGESSVGGARERG